MRETNPEHNQATPLTSAVETTVPALDAGTQVKTAEGLHPPSGLFFRSSVPTNRPILARLLLLHGYGDHSGRYPHFMHWLTLRGIACSALDFRGHGKSLGRRGYIRHWPEFLDDLNTFFEWERSPQSPVRSDYAPLFVIGHSHGGLVAAAAGIAGLLESAGCAGCILSSPYLVPKTTLSKPWLTFAWACSRLLPGLSVKSGLTAQMMTSDPAMWADSNADTLLIHGATPRWYMETRHKQAEVMQNAGRFRLPLLCLTGDADPIADPGGTEQFVHDAGSSDKSHRSYPCRLHELLRETNREEVFRDISAWIAARQTK